MRDIVCRKEYEIRVTEIDSSKRITIPGLMLLMQEASLQNIIELKVSFWDMANKGWVLLVKEFNIIRLPELGEKITVETYPAGFDRVFAYRDYKVYDQHGHIIAYAPSTWTLMDIDTRNIQRIPPMFYEMKLEKDITPLARCNRKMNTPGDVSPAESYKVNYFHLDWNGHVNNVNYLRFILEANTEKIKNYTPTKIIMHFKGESVEGDRLVVNNGYPATANESYHTITNAKDGKLLTIASIHWPK